MNCPRCLAPSCDLCRWCHNRGRLSARPYCATCTPRLVATFGRVAGERKPRAWQRGGQMEMAT